MKKKFFSCTLVVLLASLSCLSSTEITPDPTRWEETIRQFEQWDAKNAFPKDPVLFVGSSSINMWQTCKSFPDLPVINRGFGGSQTSDALYYTGRIVLPYNPKVIVFYEGDNDIAERKTPQQVFDDYCKFVALVHEKLPRTRIIFITIKPSGSRWNLWPRMSEANNLIKEFSQKGERLYFADCATPLLKDGKPDDSLFLDDHLHLNSTGYEKWTAVLRPIILDALAAAGEDCAKTADESSNAGTK